MKIADIGEGKGYFSFLISQALENKGRVFSTDINSKELYYLNKKIKEKGINNIQTVLVKPDVFDEFYSKHVFDIIFICQAHVR